MEVFTGFMGAIIGGCITLIANLIANHSENLRQYRSDAQNVYVSCIRNLSIVLTLARIEDDDERLDKIEVALAEAKAFLVLLLAQEKELPKEQEKQFNKEAEFFVHGQYDNVIETAQSNNLEPQARFQEKDYQYLQAADIILKRLIEISALDKRLKPPQVNPILFK